MNWFLSVQTQMDLSLFVSVFGSISIDVLSFCRDLAADLLHMIPDNQILLAKLCAFYPGSTADINQLHKRVTTPSP